MEKLSASLVSGPKIEHLAERRDRFPVREPVAHEGVVPELADDADPGHLPVVMHQQHPVLGGMDVELHTVGTELLREREGREGVLVRVPGGAAMGDDLGDHHWPGRWKSR